MKKILLSIALLGLFGCSSSEKAEVKSEEAAVTDQAKADIENAAENLKNEAEEMDNETKEKAQEAQQTASNDSSTAFGEYTGTEKSKVTCSMGEDVRPISVVNGDNGGCGVVYNKMGESKTVAKAVNVMEYCDEVQSKIKGNLESAGFTCE